MSPAQDPDPRARPRTFTCEVVDRVREAGNVWDLPGGQLLLPDVFGFCRGVERALEMMQDAVRLPTHRDTQIVLLGEIIHNPWVNQYFRDCGVRVLSHEDVSRLERHVTREDCAVIPAFGVTLEVERQLREIGCEVVDTSCGDVRRLWRWAEKAVGQDYAILIFGRASHDETVVTKSRLAAAGGKYVVVGKLEQAERFCEFLTQDAPAETFTSEFGPEATNADSPDAFERLAQVSQTTMLYDETMAVRDMVHAAFERRFGPQAANDRLLFHPTVCRATQDRQSAAMALCGGRCDLAVVVGGFSSSNTRHLYELARSHVPGVFIEDAKAIRSATEVETIDVSGTRRDVVRDWLPSRRPIRIAVLAGASCPEIVIGQVLERLAEFLS